MRIFFGRYRCALAIATFCSWHCKATTLPNRKAEPLTRRPSQTSLPVREVLSSEIAHPSPAMRRHLRHHVFLGFNNFVSDQTRRKEVCRKLARLLVTAAERLAAKN
jgi:hypothetical protein